MLDNSDPIARAQAGEVEAVGQLYDEHHQALFRYLWARVGERQVAEDLTGDVFLRMLKALPRYRPTAAPFRAWLYQIARNLLIDHYRRTRHHTAVPLQHAETLKDDMPDLPALVEHHLTLDRVHHALAHLDDAQREVITLRFLSGLSVEEVSQTLSKTEAAVKALQHRGLVALRQQLADQRPGQ